MATVKTRILIISDTHGRNFKEPLRSADVAIHCGDLTNESKLTEYHATIRLLKDIKAPLKLMIAGNHDFTLDMPAFERKIADAVPALDPDLVSKEYGRFGEARRILKDAAKDSGIFFLDEGNHEFRLENGARLKVYASPWTPALGAWGFQYPPSKGHKFNIGQGTDIVITHGPPKGMMDLTYARERAGCPDLFQAVARARPAIHCFGHIHEGWGAKLVRWRQGELSEPNHFNAIDNDNSVPIAKLADLRESQFDTPESMKEKRAKAARLENDSCCATSHCHGDEHPLERGEHTLFVNAAVEGEEDQLTQKPFLVDIDRAKW